MFKKLMIYDALKQAQEKRKKQVKSDVCRMCMATNVAMVGIFDCVNRNLAKDIQFCTGVIVQKTDNLPKKICRNCLAQLKTAYIFKSKCLRTEKKLNNLSSSVKTASNTIQVKKELTKQDEEKYKASSFVQREVYPIFSAPQVKKENTVNFKEKSRNETVNVKIEIERDDDSAELREEDFNDNEDFNYDSFGPPIEANEPLEYLLTPYICACGTKCETTVQKMMHVAGYHSHNMNVLKKIVPKRVVPKSNEKVMCELCGKQLASRLTLRSHYLSHQAPQLCCAHCDYKTNLKSCLVKHMKLHTGEKQYQCCYCPRMFYFSSNMLVHMRRIHEHIGVKNYQCSLCDNKYTNSSSLKRHFSSHLNAREFECEVCHSKFNNRKHLKRHLLNLHNIIMPREKRGRRKTNYLEVETKSGDLDHSASLSMILQKKG